MKSKEHIIFDLDDTLIDTSHTFWEARTRFANLFSSYSISKSEVVEIFESVDAANMNTYGLKPQRYGVSMKVASEKIIESYGIKTASNFDRKLKKYSSIIENTIPELIDGAVDLLDWASKNFRVSLLTRGIEELQTKKIHHHRLEQYFEAIKVVDKKDKEEFEDFLEEINVAPSDCWVVGDSIKSDINPALSLNISSILFLYSHHSYFWRQEYGAEASGEFYLANNLSEVKDILTSPSSFLRYSSIK